MNSFNHYALGAIGDWLYRYVAGLDVAEDGAGYSHADHPAPPRRVAGGRPRRLRLRPRALRGGVDAAERQVHT